MTISKKNHSLVGQDADMVERLGFSKSEKLWFSLYVYDGLTIRELVVEANKRSSKNWSRSSMGRLILKCKNTLLRLNIEMPKRKHENSSVYKTVVYMDPDKIDKNGVNDEEMDDLD